MAMAMNIKNPEAHELAQKVAELTGETLTEAVTTALRERLDRLLPEQRRSGAERARRLAAMKALIAKTAPIMRQGPSSAEMDDLLYDEDGLPK